MDEIRGQRASSQFFSLGNHDLLVLAFHRLPHSASSPREIDLIESNPLVFRSPGGFLSQSIPVPVSQSQPETPRVINGRARGLSLKKHSLPGRATTRLLVACPARRNCSALARKGCTSPQGFGYAIASPFVFINCQTCFAFSVGALLRDISFAALQRRDAFLHGEVGKQNWSREVLPALGRFDVDLARSGPVKDTARRSMCLTAIIYSSCRLPSSCSRSSRMRCSAAKDSR